MRRWQLAHTRAKVSRGDLHVQEMLPYFLDRLEIFKQQMNTGVLGGKLLGITRTAEQGVIVARATPFRIYKDVQDAAHQHGGYSTLLDTSLCSRLCRGDTKASVRECRCARHTLERATNVANEVLPSDGIYSLKLAVFFPVKCAQAVLNLQDYMQTHQLTATCVIHPPREAIVKYVDSILAVRY